MENFENQVREILADSVKHGYTSEGERQFRDPLRQLFAEQDMQTIQDVYSRIYHEYWPIFGSKPESPAMRLQLYVDLYKQGNLHRDFPENLYRN